MLIINEKLSPNILKGKQCQILKNNKEILKKHIDILYINIQKNRKLGFIQ